MFSLSVVAHDVDGKPVKVSDVLDGEVLMKIAKTTVTETSIPGNTRSKSWFRACELKVV